MPPGYASPISIHGSPFTSSVLTLTAGQSTSLALISNAQGNLTNMGILWYRSVSGLGSAAVGCTVNLFGRLDSSGDYSAPTNALTLLTQALVSSALALFGTTGTFLGLPLLHAGMSLSNTDTVNSAAVTAIVNLFGPAPV